MMAVDTVKLEQRAFKKFLVQRTILDSFRLYLDMSVKFVHTMEESKLLTKDELFLIKELGWPSNRNEFLKILVKKPWTRQDFDTFADILKETQHAKLSREIAEKAQDFVKAAVADAENEQRSLPSDAARTHPQTPGGSVAGLSSLPLGARTQVLSLLRDRDERIYQQSRDIERLHARINTLTAELDGTKRQLFTLDKEVTSTLAVIGVESDKGNSSCEQGMIELRERFLRQTTTIQIHKAEVEKLRAEKSQVKEKLGVLIEEGIKSKKTNADWVNNYNSLKTSTDEELKALRNRVSQQGEILEATRRKHSELEVMHLAGSKGYEQEIQQLQQKLNVTDKNMQQAVITRDRAITELLRMKDDTRKLLKSLNLEQQGAVKGTTSLNHARNMVHIQKRQAQITARTGGGTATPTKSYSTAPTKMDSTAPTKPDSIRVLEGTKEKKEKKEEHTLPLLPNGSLPAGGFSSSRSKPKPFLQAKVPPPSPLVRHSIPTGQGGTSMGSSPQSPPMTSRGVDDTARESPAIPPRGSNTPTSVPSTPHSAYNKHQRTRGIKLRA